MAALPIPCVLALTGALLLAGCTSTLQDISGQGSNDWALAMTHADDLHEDGLTGAGVKVAVVDTGIIPQHDEFDGVRIEWSDVVHGDSRAYDDNGHGTHVSGLVVAQGAGGSFEPRVEGVAPGATLIHVKAIPGTRPGTGEDVARAIQRAVNQGADVLVLSLGGKPGLPLIGQEVEDAVNEAIDRGVVVVAAAGNAPDGESGASCTVVSPASVPRVIAAGAVDRSREIADFSCTGDNSGGPLGLLAPRDPNRKPELVAPGVGLIGPWPRDASTPCAGELADYCMLSGTSQAAPIVGGIVALLLEAHPELKRRGPQQVETVKRALTQTAEDVGGVSGHDDRYGYGLVRADLALQRLG